MSTTTKLAIFLAFSCILIEYSNALQCNAGIDGKGWAPPRKQNFLNIFQCCYKYANVISPVFTYFGAVPPALSKQACHRAGKCFFSPELNKNVCVCANADDPNCEPGPIKVSQSEVTTSPK